MSVVRQVFLLTGGMVCLMIWGVLTQARTEPANLQRLAHTSVNFGLTSRQIMVMDVRQTQSHHLTRTGNRLGLSWSHDGRWIAYIDVAGTQTSLNRIASVSGHVEHLANLNGFTATMQPEWYGERIVMSMIFDGREVPIVVDRTGITVLSDRGGESPTWSPDGQWIAFAYDGELYRVRPDATELSAITSEPDIFFTNPDWSQDWIVAEGGQGATVDVFRIDPQTGQHQNLTRSATVDGFPSVSPDGQWIVFVRTDRTQSVMLVSIDGRQLVEVASANSNAPAWSPDGQWLAFQRFAQGNTNIFRVPALEPISLCSTGGCVLADARYPRGVLYYPGIAEPLAENQAPDEMPTWAPIVDMEWRPWLFLAGALFCGVLAWR